MFTSIFHNLYYVKRWRNFLFSHQKHFFLIFNLMTLKKCHFLTTINYSHKLMTRKNNHKSRKKSKIFHYSWKSAFFFIFSDWMNVVYSQKLVTQKNYPKFRKFWKSRLFLAKQMREFGSYDYFFSLPSLYLAFFLFHEKSNLM